MILGGGGDQQVLFVCGIAIGRSLLFRDRKVSSLGKEVKITLRWIDGGQGYASLCKNTYFVTRKRTKHLFWRLLEVSRCFHWHRGSQADRKTCISLNNTVRGCSVTCCHLVPWQQVLQSRNVRAIEFFEECSRWIEVKTDKIHFFQENVPPILRQHQVRATYPKNRILLRASTSFINMISLLSVRWSLPQSFGIQAERKLQHLLTRSFLVWAILGHGLGSDPPMRHAKHTRHVKMPWRCDLGPVKH